MQPYSAKLLNEMLISYQSINLITTLMEMSSIYIPDYYTVASIEEDEYIVFDLCKFMGEKRPTRMYLDVSLTNLCSSLICSLNR